MHIKTSTFVAAGILVLAGTPAALHLMGGAGKKGTVSWIHALHGGGAGHGTEAGHSSGSASSEGSVVRASQSASSLTGKWAVTVEGPGGAIETRMVLKQDGEKITGTFGNPHGGADWPVIGEYAKDVLTLTIEAKGDHGDMHASLKGALKKDDGSLTGTMTSTMGESNWTAKRSKD